MNATTSATGTSLELLAPYLPYKLFVQHKNANGTFQVQAISADFEESLVYCCDTERHSEWTFDVNEVTPVLKPFWQLCDRFPDGIVPAIEALRLALGWPKSFYENRFTARLINSIPGEWCVRVENHYDHSGGWIRLGGDYGAWLFEAFDSYEDGIGKAVKVVNPLAAYNYLRSQHFAVDLEPHQYIEKSPAPTPTIQGGGKSHE